MTASNVQLAKLIRLTGYVLSFITGIALWPQLIEYGYKMENTHFGLAILFVWGCLPGSMIVTHVISFFAMRMAYSIDPVSSGLKLSDQITAASFIGIFATLGSCGVIAAGYEPPAPIGALYDLDLSGRFR